MLEEKAFLFQSIRLSRRHALFKSWTLPSEAHLKINFSDLCNLVEVQRYRNDITLSVIHLQNVNSTGSRLQVIAHRHGRPCLTICRSNSERSSSSTNEGDVAAAPPNKGISRGQYDSDDSSRFEFSGGPAETSGPKFSRLPHSSLSFIPVNDPAAALPPATKVKLKQGIRRGRRAWKKITAPQAMTGAIFGALWAVIALKGTALAYERLDSHPLAHDLPLGLTKQVNQLLLTTLNGIGGFAVVMFSVTSCGLFLLSLTLLSAPKPPS